MLVTRIHCSDYSAEGILKTVLLFFLATSFRPIMDLHVFCLVGVYGGPVCSHCLLCDIFYH